MIRFLHLADLHLGASLATLEPHQAAARQRDLQSALERAVDYALEPDHAVHAVVIAGDLLDSATPPDAVVDDALQQFGRLASGRVPIVLAPGNHDALGMPGSVYGRRRQAFEAVAHLVTEPNVAPVAELTLNGSRVAFYGMAWQPGLSRPPYDAFRARAQADYHVAVLHATLDRATHLELHSRDVPLSLARLAETGMDYIALGHIHSYQAQIVGRGLAIYPGTLEGVRLTAGEVGQRCLTVVTLQQGQVPAIERIPWNQRTLAIETLDLNTLAVESEDELVGQIRERLAGPDRHLRLTLRGGPAFVVDADALQERLEEAFFALTLVDETDAFQSQQTLTWAQEPTIRGLCVRRLQQELDRAASDEERQRVELALKLVVRSLEASVSP